MNEIAREKESKEALMNLSSKYHNLKQDYNLLQGDYASLQEKIETLTNENKNLKKENKELSEKLAKLQDKSKEKENINQNRDIFKIKRKSHDSSNSSIKTISPPFFNGSISPSEQKETDLESPIKRLKVNNKQQEATKSNILGGYSMKLTTNGGKVHRVLNIFDIMVKDQEENTQKTLNQKKSSGGNHPFDCTFEKNSRDYHEPSRRKDNSNDINFTSDTEIDFPHKEDEISANEKWLEKSLIKIKEEPKTQDACELNKSMDEYSEELFSSFHLTDSVEFVENSQQPVQTYLISDNELENTDELEKQFMKTTSSSMPNNSSREVYPDECDDCKQYFDERVKEIGVEKINMEIGKCKNYCSGYAARVETIRKKPNFKPMYQTIQATSRARRADKEDKEERYTPDSYWDLQVSPVQNQHLKIRKD